MTKIYLCLDNDDRIIDIMTTDYEMIHPERIPWDVADFTIVGDKYNRITGLVEAVAPEPETIYTKLKFRQRFTLEELTSIYTAEATDIIIKIFLDDLSASEFIDLSDINTQNGIGYLFNAGYITYERMLEILG